MSDGRKTALVYRAAFYVVNNGQLSKEDRKAVATVLRDLRNGKVQIHALIQ